MAELGGWSKNRSPEVYGPKGQFWTSIFTDRGEVGLGEVEVGGAADGPLENAAPPSLMLREAATLSYLGVMVGPAARGSSSYESTAPGREGASSPTN